MVEKKPALPYYNCLHMSAPPGIKPLHRYASIIISDELRLDLPSQKTPIDENTLPFAVPINNSVAPANHPYIKEPRNLQTVWKEVNLPDIEGQNARMDRMRQQVEIDKLTANLAFALGNADEVQAALDYYTELYGRFFFPKNDAPSPLDK